MVAFLESLLPLLVVAGVVVGAVVGDGFDPDCPDGRPEGDLDPDDPCAGYRSQSRTDTNAPWWPQPLRVGEPLTFRCAEMPCYRIAIEVPPGGAANLTVKVTAEMAGGYSARASMAPGEHWEPMWADGAYYDGGQPHEQAFDAGFAATAWMLEVLSMWDGAGGNVTVEVAFA